MMMIVPISLARKKKGIQGEGEEEAGDQRKVDQTETPTSSADAHRSLSIKGVICEEQEKKWSVM